ncbi:hypothetical protein FEM48_Zijuj07G0081600 [Ziziphus jujuba var. spinosa]|uniref:Reverse transcriptase/retrotransposon-derived protein RNase H-like domain-containing protein n=1 Tax=Ziziphus jujuba var. spinosa TaxID=714518 RepID=A0A978V3H3_ZIZJJ|nr:hypothetical protein FEM48_Zijuj07G0081600 [Ziziphus jujuba var. spinosa]
MIADEAEITDSDLEVMPEEPEGITSKFHSMRSRERTIHKHFEKRMECAGLHHALTLQIQGCPITADYYVLPIATYPIVLGLANTVNIREVHGFLFWVGYYRKFIKHFGGIIAPLTKLLSKEGFKWTQECDEAFQQLKMALTTAPILALPDFSQPFVIECNPSGNGIGAVLSQNDKPFAYFSQALQVTWMKTILPSFDDVEDQNEA